MADSATPFSALRYTPYRQTEAEVLPVLPNFPCANTHDGWRKPTPNCLDDAGFVLAFLDAYRYQRPLLSHYSFSYCNRTQTFFGRFPLEPGLR